MEKPSSVSENAIPTYVKKVEDVKHLNGCKYEVEREIRIIETESGLEALYCDIFPTKDMLRLIHTRRFNKTEKHPDTEDCRKRLMKHFGITEADRKA